MSYDQSITDILQKARGAIVGITYDSYDDGLHNQVDERFAQADKPVTIAAVSDWLTHAGFNAVHIGGIRSLVSFLAEGNDIAFVFNSCAGFYGVGHESQVAALLEAARIPYTFSDPIALTIAQDKHLAKTVAQSLGIKTAPWRRIRELTDIHGKWPTFPLCIKPATLGDSIGVHDHSVTFNESEAAIATKRILETFGVPALIEEYLPGDEYTVGILGSGRDACFVGAMRVSQACFKKYPIYTFENKSQFDGRTIYERVEDFAVLETLRRYSLMLWREIGGRDAGRMDFKVDNEGDICFLEVNCLPGLHPISSDLVNLCLMHGVSYDALLSSIIARAAANVRGINQMQ